MTFFLPLILAASVAQAPSFESQAHADWYRRMELPTLTEIEFQDWGAEYVPLSGDVHSDLTTLQTLIELELRRASIKFMTPSEVNALLDNPDKKDSAALTKDLATYDRFTKQPGAVPELFVQVTPQQVLDTDIYRVEVSFDLLEWVPSPLAKRRNLQTSLWKQEKSSYVRIGKVDETARQAVTDLVEKFTNDWLAAHDPAFPKVPPPFH